MNDKQLELLIKAVAKGNCDDQIDIDLSSADFTSTRPFQLYVGVEGIVIGKDIKGNDFNRHFIVGYHPIVCKQITRTGTEATDLGALFL